LSRRSRASEQARRVDNIDPISWPDPFRPAYRARNGDLDIAQGDLDVALRRVRLEAVVALAQHQADVAPQARLSAQLGDASRPRPPVATIDVRLGDDLNPRAGRVNNHIVSFDGLC